MGSRSPHLDAFPPPIPLSPVARQFDPSRPLLPANDLSPANMSYQQPHAEGTEELSPLREPNSWLAQLPPSWLELYEQNTGLALVAVCQIFFAAMNITVKWFLTESEISTLMLIWVRQVVSGVFCIISLYVMGDPNPVLGPPEVRRSLAARGFFGFFGLAANYQSFRYLSVSDSTVIGFLAPSATAVLAYFVLREKLGRREVLAGLFCLVGVICVSRPPFIFGRFGEQNPPIVGSPSDGGDGEGAIPGEFPEEDMSTSERMVGVSWALFAVVGSSAAYTTIRLIGTRAHAMHSMAYFAYYCTIVTTFGLLVLPGPIAFPSTFRAYFLITLIGIFGFIAQTLLTMGLQREKAGRAGLAIYLNVVFAIVLELFVFGTIPAFLSLVGTAIIIASACWVALGPRHDAEAAREHDKYDPESQPLSRSPSPIPPPGQTTRRGEHYSYTSIATTEPVDAYDDHEHALETDDVPELDRKKGLATPSVSRKSGDSHLGLSVPNGGPGRGLRRQRTSSTASSASAPGLQ